MRRKRLTRTVSQPLLRTHAGCEVKPSQTLQPDVSHWSCGVFQREAAKARVSVTVGRLTERRSAVHSTHTATWEPAALTRKRGNWGSSMVGGR